MPPARTWHVGRAGMAKNDDERLELRVRRPSGLDDVDSTAFVLDAESRSRFVEVAEPPAQDSSGLEKLFAEPSVFGPAQEPRPGADTVAGCCLRSLSPGALARGVPRAVISRSARAVSTMRA